MFTHWRITRSALLRSITWRFLANENGYDSRSNGYPGILPASPKPTHAIRTLPQKAEAAIADVGRLPHHRLEYLPSARSRPQVRKGIGREFLQSVRKITTYVDSLPTEPNHSREG